MNGDGVFCTVNGTVTEGAKGVIPIEIVPASRTIFPGSDEQNDVISVGYFKNKDVIRYDVKATSGEVSVGGPSSGSDGKYMKGDANEDGEVSLADAVLIMQSISNPNEEKFKLSEQGTKNADTNGDGTVTVADALEIQMFMLELPSAFD
ncbi:MAG: dockerin type I repeat-containing protein [Ruminococcus sp.]|nr:dockerin type I repeat-containing protein [Ruminococcus sp.]